jgi:hypothetical protein
MAPRTSSLCCFLRDARATESSALDEKEKDQFSEEEEREKGKKDKLGANMLRNLLLERDDLPPRDEKLFPHSSSFFTFPSCRRNIESMSGCVIPEAAELFLQACDTAKNGRSLVSKGLELGVLAIEVLFEGTGQTERVEPGGRREGKETHRLSGRSTSLESSSSLNRRRLLVDASTKTRAFGAKVGLKNDELVASLLEFLREGEGESAQGERERGRGLKTNPLESLVLLEDLSLLRSKIVRSRSAVLKNVVLDLQLLHLSVGGGESRAERLALGAVRGGAATRCSQMREDRKKKKRGKTHPAKLTPLRSTRSCTLLFASKEVWQSGQ